ncbi:MAG TPA: Gfo/Idh/MocA family oxidoreductase [Limnobacter sp.]|nr:Gfo/Idh/MocA family oxidoreductase [Limnobacter sp.]
MGERYLVVGLGSIGARHLSNLKTLRPEASLAVLRTGLSSQPQATIPFEFQTLNSIEQSLRFEPNAVVIANPANMHVETALPFLEAGIPVLLEKPLGLNYANCAPLKKYLERGTDFCMVGYNLRFLPALLETRRRLLGGEIGELLHVRAQVGQYLPDWRPGKDHRVSGSARRALGGGPLLELSHELDYLRWILGQPSRVYCAQKQLSLHDMDVPDSVDILMEHGDDGPMAVVHLDFLQRTPNRDCQFVGTNGTLIWKALDDEVWQSIPGSKAWKIDSYKIPDRNLMYLNQLEYFLTKAARIENTACDLAGALDVMRTIDACELSSQTEAWVTVNQQRPL